MRDELEGLRELQDAMGGAEVGLARRLGMNPRDMVALTHIAFAATPPQPTDVAHRLGLSPSAVTVLLDRLGDAGHITRERSLHDRRLVELHITESATASVIEHLQPLFAAVESVLDTFTTTQQALIGRFLSDVADAYRDYARSD